MVTLTRGRSGLSIIPEVYHLVLYNLWSYRTMLKKPMTNRELWLAEFGYDFKSYGKTIKVKMKKKMHNCIILLIFSERKLINVYWCVNRLYRSWNFLLTVLFWDNFFFAQHCFHYLQQNIWNTFKKYILQNKIKYTIFFLWSIKHYFSMSIWKKNIL